MLMSRVNHKVAVGVGRPVVNRAAMSSVPWWRKASDSHATSKFLETGTKTVPGNLERKLQKITKIHLICGYFVNGTTQTKVIAAVRQAPWADKPNIPLTLN